MKSKSAFVIISILVIGFLVLVFDAIGQTQNPPLDAVGVLTSISSQVKKIEEKVGSDRSVKDKTIEVRRKIRELSEFIVDSKKSGFSANYVNSLVVYDETLRTFAESPARDPGSLLNILEGLSEDLTAKIVFARASRGSSNSDITVVARTIENDAEISGFVVWFVPRAWLDAKSHYQRFDRISSPSILELPPGNYFIWAEKGALHSAPQPVSLGADKRSRKEIDIVVP